MPLPARLAVAAVALLAGPVVPAPAATAAIDPGAVTKVVVKISGCDDCRLLPSSSIDDGRLWQGTPTRVRDGRAVFTVPTRRTRGLRLALDAPFEGSTGGVPHVVLHYQGLRRGEAVTSYDATTARKGSVCFAGTAKARLVLSVRVEQVRIDGASDDGEQVVGALAWATTSQRTLRPFELVRDGYFAAQAVPVCQG